MPLGSDVVPDECSTNATSSASRGDAVGRRVLGDQRLASMSGRIASTNANACAAACALGDLALAAEREQALGARLREPARQSWVSLNIGGSGARTAPR